MSSENFRAVRGLCRGSGASFKRGIRTCKNLCQGLWYRGLKVEVEGARITSCEASDAHRLFFRGTAEYGGWVTDADPLQAERVFQRRWDHVRLRP